MQYRTLGGTGIKVSPYAFGAMMLGASIGNPDHDDCIRIIHKALDAGINFIDTADRYSQGASEEVVGKALKGRRDRVVLATKFSGSMGDDPNQQGTPRALACSMPSRCRSARISRARAPSMWKNSRPVEVVVSICGWGTMNGAARCTVQQRRVQW